MMFSSVSAGLLERYRNGLPDRPTFSELDMLAAQVPAGAEGLRLDQVAALRFAPDMFIGRSSIHQRGHEVRAIMEGVALELRRQVTTLCGDALPASVQAAGGAARSATWLKIKSEVLGCPVEAVACPEPTSMGAARLVQASGI
jgi:sugar (pentulose or hexulose) kinase